MGFRQIKYQDRLLIADLLKEEKSFAAIARKINKNKSSVAREVIKGWNDKKKEYDPELAQKITDERAVKSGRERKNG